MCTSESGKGWSKVNIKGVNSTAVWRSTSEYLAHITQRASRWTHDDPSYQMCLHQGVNAALLTQDIHMQTHKKLTYTHTQTNTQQTHTYTYTNTNTQQTHTQTNTQKTYIHSTYTLKAWHTHTLEASKKIILTAWHTHTHTHTHMKGCHPHLWTSEWLLRSGPLHAEGDLERISTAHTHTHERLPPSPLDKWMVPQKWPTSRGGRLGEN